MELERDACVNVVLAGEPQHPPDALQADREHGEQWVTCRRCGRQWAVRGDVAESVTDGDGWCDQG